MKFTISLLENLVPIIVLYVFVCLNTYLIICLILILFCIFYQTPPQFTAHEFFALKYAFSFSPVPPAFSALSAHFSKYPKLSFFSLVPQKGHSKEYLFKIMK